MTKPLTMGAVLYDPKVSVIWDIIRDFVEQNGIAMDVVYFTNYERQVDALVAGMIDIAWHSPLAWVDTERRARGAFDAIAMRDTDRDRRTHIVARKGAGARSLGDLRGKAVALGAADSPQATLIPIEFLRANGLERGDYEVRRFDVMVGKHGDHIGGELEAFRCLARGEAAASAMLDLNWETWTGDGTIDPAEFTVLATTPPFDHCVFALRRDWPAEARAKWLGALFSMNYDDPRHRQMMDMEGLKAWLPGRTTGFGLLNSAVEHLGFFRRAGGEG